MADIDLLDDDIDHAWRAGFAGLIPTDDADPVARIEGHLRRRQRARVAARAVAAAALIALVVGVISYTARPHRASVANRPATDLVVIDGPRDTLHISLPDPHLAANLPAGKIRFIVHMTSTHALRLAGVPGFLIERPPASHGTATLVKTVRLEPGRYKLYCAIPGHATAGEVVWITVR